MAKGNGVLWIAGTIGGIMVLAMVANAVNPPPEPKHGCSGYMDARLRGTENEAQLRRQLCDEGGEKKLQDMIDARNKELAKPAF